MEQDLETIRRAFAVPDEEWRKIADRFRFSRYAKGELAVREGAPFREIGYVLRGLFRIYHGDVAGREVTKAFRAGGDFVSPYAEVLRGQAPRTNVEALEASEVAWISYDRLDELARGSLYWSRLLRAQAEKHFLLKEQREWEFLTLSAQEQYARFLAEYKDVSERIPQFLIASYLGITSVALSRIVARMRAGK
jgi:CRP-like cAMP-binding protein